MMVVRTEILSCYCWIPALRRLPDTEKVFSSNVRSETFLPSIEDDAGDINLFIVH